MDTEIPISQDPNQVVDNEHPYNKDFRRQAFLYFSFAILMMGFNTLLQNFYLDYLVPWIISHLGEIRIIAYFYLEAHDFNYIEFIGSGIAVIITYLTKFLLDKYIVFKSKTENLRETGKQFSIYFILAVLTTIENLGIQALLGWVTHWDLNLRIIIALSCGYLTKFFLDRKYCFSAECKI